MLISLNNGDDDETDVHKEKTFVNCWYKKNNELISTVVIYGSASCPLYIIKIGHFSSHFLCGMAVLNFENLINGIIEEWRVDSQFFVVSTWRIDVTRGNIIKNEEFNYGKA